MPPTLVEEVETETELQPVITCRNRVLRKLITPNCEKCQRDYNQDHHPNNFDCPRHTPMKVWYFDFKNEIYEPNQNL